MALSRAVHINKRHIDNRGDCVERKYDATYHFGKTVVHIVAPPPMSKEEIEKTLQGYDRAFWDGWFSLSLEERQRINAERARKRKDG